MGSARAPAGTKDDMTMPTPDLSTRLRVASDDITFQDHPQKALLREAAEGIESLGALAASFFVLLYDIENLDPSDTELKKAEFRGKVRELAARRKNDQGINDQRVMSAEAAEEQQKLGMWLVTTFQPGLVDDAAVLHPRGEYESGAGFCRRALQLAVDRGAFDPKRGILAQDCRITAGNLFAILAAGAPVQGKAREAQVLLDKVAAVIDPQTVEDGDSWADKVLMGPREAARSNALEAAWQAIERQADIGFTEIYGEPVRDAESTAEIELIRGVVDAAIHGKAARDRTGQEAADERLGLMFHGQRLPVIKATPTDAVRDVLVHGRKAGEAEVRLHNDSIIAVIVDAQLAMQLSAEGAALDVSLVDQTQRKNGGALK